MTTPQDPGDRPDGADGPQDPSDPQNPYGTPPPPVPAPGEPPTTAIPPAPPVYGTDPAAAPPPLAAPPYGQPAQPPYDQPAYDQPAQPGYPPQAAQPGYGQPYAAPQYGAPAEAPPGKGMAIGALIASILGCTCIGALVAIPLAIVVLLRSRDGRNHGKGLAIAALVISVVSLAGVGVGGYALYDYAKDFKSVEDLEAGDCITAEGLTDADATDVSSIRTVACSEEHDGEVLAVVDLTAEQAAAFEETPIEEFCRPAIEAAGKSGVLVEGIDVTALTELDPEAGDNAACIGYNSDGSSLEGRLAG